MNRVGPVEQATTAFGQGVSVTPIQQVTAVSAAVNGGILYKPFIAKELIDPVTQEIVPKKYFSGGFGFTSATDTTEFSHDRALRLEIKDAQVGELVDAAAQLNFHLVFSQHALADGDPQRNAD